ncbi:MAG TPA: O-antigen ligase family protein [Bryobacterales bacterium]|nr:O-antigen ligase family protein [Bryobacterales bacterium]
MKGNPPWRWAARSAVALGVLLCFSILTDAARERWAISLFQAGVFGLAIVWAAGMIFRPWRWRGSVLLIPLGGTILWGLLQLETGSTVYRFATWNSILGWMANFVLFFVSLQVFGFFEIRRAFQKALLWFGFALSVISVIQFFTSKDKIFWIFPTQYAEQALGPFVNRDHYASFIALVLPFVLYRMLQEGRKSGAYAAMAGAMFASVIAGASRAGAILVTAEIVVLLAASLWGNNGARRAGMVNLTRIIFFAAVFTAVAGGGVLWKRFQDPNPFGGRREILQSSLSMMRDRPWTGFGLGAWPAVYPGYAVFDAGVTVNHAHNDWVEWGAEGGIPFLAMLLAVFVWSVRSALRFPWGAGVVAVFLHSLVDFPLQKPCLAALVFVLLGALAASARDRPAGCGAG